MQNTCPNPGCGAMYNLTAQHAGRSFVCKKCGATLLVTEDGLELAGGSPGADPVAPSSEDPTPMRRPTRGSGGAGAIFRQYWDRVRGDASTWLFGAGAFFTIICLFFPLLDRAKVDRRRIKVEAGDRREQRLTQDLQRKRMEGGGQGDKLAQEEETRKKAMKHWQEVDKPKLQEEVDDANDSARAWKYWYQWGMMWGFLFLALAALGYLTPTQPTIRRVVGSIIICAMMLLIFMRFILESGIKG